MKAFSSNRVSLSDITDTVSEREILSYYLGITKLPILINSPLRKDTKPSMALRQDSNNHIFWKDFATNECGIIHQLLAKMWNTSEQDALDRIYSEMCSANGRANPAPPIERTNYYRYLGTSTKIQCRVREWQEHDKEYWKSFGIPINLLKFAEVYPISHIIVTKNNRTFPIKADRFAYVYIERKDNTVSIKIYQPYNTHGYKWTSKHDGSVISLWDKVPERGEKLCICSSVKDALCLWYNAKIPSIATQGEGYKMSKTAVDNLKSRYNKVYICYDNDTAGIKDAEKLSKETGFINVVIPKFEGGKDISDLMKAKGKEVFLNILLPLFN